MPQSADAGLAQLVAVTLARQSSKTLIALSGTSQDLWALSADGEVVRGSATGSAPQLSVAVDFNRPLVALVVLDAGVYLAGSTDQFACAGSCATPADFTATSVTASQDQLVALCSGSSGVFAVGSAGSAGSLFQYQPVQQTWRRARVPVSYPTQCAVANDGAVFVVGEDGLARFVPADGGATSDALVFETNWPALSVTADSVRLGDRRYVMSRVDGGRGVEFVSEFDAYSLGQMFLATHGDGGVDLVMQASTFLYSTNWARFVGGRWVRGTGFVTYPYLAWGSPDGETFIVSGQSDGGATLERVVWPPTP